MLGEHRFNLFVGREASLPRRLEPAVDPFKLLGRRMIDPALEIGVDFERDLGKLLLLTGR